MLERQGCVRRSGPRGIAVRLTLGIAGLVLWMGCGKNPEVGENGLDPGESKTPAAHANAADAPSSIRFVGRPLEFNPLPCGSALLIEPSTNTVLYEQNAHQLRAPASIVKMSLELVVMRDVEAKRLALGDSIRVSAWASNIGGSQAYLAEGEVFPLDELMKAITIHSANDACVAVAEHIAGTSDGFVDLMNREIEDLGLKETHYVNVHGLDDDPGAGNHSSAWDISQIARELIHYPHVLEWSSMDKVPFRGGAFVLENTNHLVGNFEGLDGLKTGYTEKAGFCLCATAERRGVRLISVVMGCDTNRDRFRESAQLLAAGFNAYSLVPGCEKGAEIEGEVLVRGGKPKAVKPVAGEAAQLLVSRPDDRRIQRRFVARTDLKAPLEAGAVIGTLQFVSGDRVLTEVPAVTPLAVEATGIGAWFRKVTRRG